MRAKDTLYARRQPRQDFVFDERVTAVFADMIGRSVPGYSVIVQAIGALARQYAQPDSRCYDLGCSLGAAALSMGRQIQADGCKVIAVDNSPAMIAACKRAMAQEESPAPVELLLADIEEVPIARASVVALNLTLQFIALERREALMRKIYQGLLPGGALVLTEKIRFEDAALEALFTAMHHRFKEQRGYSKLEISRKRAALEKVLIPETLAAHEGRLRKAGFSHFKPWFQCFNFASMLALKN